MKFVKTFIAFLFLLFAAAPHLHAQPCPPHPRLFFNEAELQHLRSLRNEGNHARIWKSLAASADWCLEQKPRKEWIAPVSPDPDYSNLYDRFYAMMHDMAIMEHLAFAHAYSGDERYFDAARDWTMASCRVWRREADGDPDQSKAYAVTRILKGLAVGYDLLYHKMNEADRRELRDMLAETGRKYYAYFQDPVIAGEGHNKHHGSVEAASFGVLAIALLGQEDDLPEAAQWLELITRKHTEYLLPQALTPSGTQEQSSNFWASTMQYRIFFMDALRRATGRDLFKEFAKYMREDIALAAVAGPNSPGRGEDQQSILFAPSYGQLDYWSPVLFFLAKEYRRPIDQRLALWDRTAGSIQRTRYVTKSGEELLFEMGGYAYAWCGNDVPDLVSAGLPLSFLFPEVNEAYARSSYDAGGIVVGMRLGTIIIHAGGKPVFIDEFDPHKEPKPVADLSLVDMDGTALIRCSGVEDSGFADQELKLVRPGKAELRRKTGRPVKWWCHGNPARDGNDLKWAGGTELRIVKGKITAFDAGGHLDAKVVGMGKLKLEDPTPIRYPSVTAEPVEGELVLEVTAP